MRQVMPQDEVIVVGLFDKVLLSQFPGVTFISTGIGVNAATARNKGMAAAKNEVFLFIDSDCIPDDNCLQIHRYYQTQGHKILGGGVEIDNSNLWIRADNLSMFHNFSSTNPPDNKFLLPTLNLSVHRSVWEHLGGLDESFPKAGGEDSDWTLRMRLSGYELKFLPQASVRHVPERGCWNKVYEHWYRSGQNNIRVRLKYDEQFGTPQWVRSAICLKIFSPLIAAWVTLKIAFKAELRTYWSCLPVVYATKVIYCWGAAETVGNLK
jgi:GT2 family glycosyltransferase